MSYVYRKRTPAEFEQFRRRRELEELTPRVRRGDERAKARAVELLQAEGLRDIAELIADACWPKRGAPSLNPVKELKDYFVAIMREQRKYRDGRFGKGERQALLNQIMIEHGELGEFDALSDADFARLQHEVVAALNRSVRKRRRALHR
jgi:hypothetical protein